MIAVDDAGPAWVVTLSRPEKANALTGAMLAELTSIARRAAEGPKAVIFTGHGKVFSAGADLDEVPKGLDRDPVWEDLSGAVADLPCLTVAALNGTLAGGAFGLALACDLRISVPQAKFFYPVMERGYLPQPSDPGRLTELVGPGRAKLILLAGQRIDAPTALSFGLIDEIAEDPLARAHELAQAPLSATPEHLAAIKSLV